MKNIYFLIILNETTASFLKGFRIFKLGLKYYDLKQNFKNENKNL